MEVCRLCLDLQSDNNYLPLAGNYKDMVQVVAPELNLEISNAPVVCNECSSNLDELFVFKTKCFENEQKIRPKCENNKNKFRLKQVLDGTTDVEETALKPDKTKDRVCRTCMEPIESESFTILKPSEPDAYLDSMLTMCLNDIDLELTKDPVICESCMDNLQKLHHFKSTSLDVEDKLTNFCETHGTNSSEQINLNSVLEYEISKTDADSGFVNVKVENYEDESEDASMKSEMGSEMTVDSELKQEEIDIKSEAGTSSDKKSYECSECDFKTAYKNSFRRHVQVLHKKSNELKHSCSKCDFKTGYLQYLRGHVTAVHEKVHQCAKCNYKTGSPTKLKRHMQVVHENIKTHVCSKCDFKTGYLHCLKKHTQAIHGNVLQKCSNCDYETTQWKDLRRHVKANHENRINYACTKCSYNTCAIYRLRNHVKAVHDVLREHECFECDYKAAHLSDLQKHVKAIHEKRKDFKCLVCDFETAHRKSLKRHLQRKHEIKSA